MDEGIELIYKDLASSFSKWTNYDGILVKKWLKYQLQNQQLVDIFWSGGNQDDELLNAAEYLRPYLSESHRLISELQKDPPILIGENERASRRFGSTVWFCAAYAFHGFAKGRLYGNRISGGPTYQSHWFRSRALPNREENEKDFRDEIPIECFPWGEILSELVKTEEGIFSNRAVDEIQNTLKILRSFTKNHDPLSLCSKGELALRDFALTGLKAIGWLPHNSFSKMYQQLLFVIDKYVKELVRDRSTFIGLLIQQFDLSPPKLFPSGKPSPNEQLKIEKLWHKHDIQAVRKGCAKYYGENKAAR